MRNILRARARNLIGRKLIGQANSRALVKWESLWFGQREFVFVFGQVGEWLNLAHAH